MKISASFLSIDENIKENIQKLDTSTVDFLHLDIMDGIFVPNKTWTLSEMKNIINGHTKPLDVHLMVKDVYHYIDKFAKLNPYMITFHYEAVEDPYLVIDYIKSYGIKAGISIKPETEIVELEDLLDYVDLVLIMSVEPGMGGQKFIPETLDKIKYLKNKKKCYNYLIEVDGGINDKNIKDLKCDIAVVGSFITNSDDYNAQITKLKYPVN